MFFNMVAVICFIQHTEFININDKLLSEIHIHFYANTDYIKWPTICFYETYQIIPLSIRCKTTTTENEKGNFSTPKPIKIQTVVLKKYSSDFIHFRMQQCIARTAPRSYECLFTTI